MLARELREGDLCVVMGAGDVDALGRALAADGAGEPTSAGARRGASATTRSARMTTIGTGGPAEHFARAGTWPS